MVAFNNACAEGAFPGAVPVDEELAALGARMLFEGDGALIHSLAGIFEVAGAPGATVRISRWNRVFVDIAYCLLPPHPLDWHEYDLPVCTCRIWGQQQTCQHLLYGDALGLPGFTPAGLERLDFTAGPQAGIVGRPKGNYGAHYGN